MSFRAVTVMSLPSRLARRTSPSSTDSSATVSVKLPSLTTALFTSRRRPDWVSETLPAAVVVNCSELTEVSMPTAPAAMTRASSAVSRLPAA